MFWEKSSGFWLIKVGAALNSKPLHSRAAVLPLRLIAYTHGEQDQVEGYQHKTSTYSKDTTRSLTMINVAYRAK